MASIIYRHFLRPSVVLALSAAIIFGSATHGFFYDSAHAAPAVGPSNVRLASCLDARNYSAISHEGTQGGNNFAATILTYCREESRGPFDRCLDDHRWVDLQQSGAKKAAARAWDFCEENYPER